jgi:hypothetical protein
VHGIRVTGFDALSRKHLSRGNFYDLLRVLLVYFRFDNDRRNSWIRNLPIVGTSTVSRKSVVEMGIDRTPLWSLLGRRRNLSFSPNSVIVFCFTGDTWVLHSVSSLPTGVPHGVPGDRVKGFVQWESTTQMESSKTWSPLLWPVFWVFMD